MYRITMLALVLALIVLVQIVRWRWPRHPKNTKLLPGPKGECPTMGVELAASTPVD